jgi:hypothetical protein
MKKITLFIIAFPLLFSNCFKEDLKITEPDANFTYNVVTLAPDALVEFISTSKNTQTLEWDFGDGEFESGIDPIHNYKKAGIYSVTLTATINNKSKSVTKVVEVKGGDFMEVFIKKISIKKIPATDNNGDTWDPTDGPDLYVILEDAGGRFDLNTLPALFNNNNSFPVTWELNPSLKIQDLFEDYTLYVIDYDHPKDPTVITQCKFDFESFDDYPTKAEFICGGAIIEFELAWF